jgi:hypothetical protein
MAWRSMCVLSFPIFNKSGPIFREVTQPPQRTPNRVTAVRQPAPWHPSHTKKEADIDGWREAGHEGCLSAIRPLDRGGVQVKNRSTLIKNQSQI